MRLTADLIHRCPTFVNTVNERELDLRGNKLQVIENLGATQDEYEAMDLSDNQIVSLGNFPILRRLRTLFINNNAVAQVVPGIGKGLPGLETLMLINNDIASLVDLKALGEMPRLTHVALNDNPVTQVPHYREYVIFRCPALEALDFQRVTRKERYLAGKFFAQAAGAELLASMEGSNGRAAISQGSTKRQKMDQQRQQEAEAVRARIRSAIMKAESIEDLAKLQAALRDQNHSEAFMRQLESIEADIAKKH